MIYLSKTKLRERGWTDNLIERFLSKPDRTGPNPHDPASPPIPLYLLTRVERVEASAAYRCARRRMAEIRSQTQRKVLAGVRGEFGIPIPLLPENRILDRACDRIDEFAHSAARFAVEDRDWSFLDRVAVDHIRHEVGGGTALEVIADTLPSLAKESQRQQAAEPPPPAPPPTVMRMPPDEHIRAKYAGVRTHYFEVGGREEARAAERKGYPYRLIPHANKGKLGTPSTGIEVTRPFTPREIELRVWWWKFRFREIAERRRLIRTFNKADRDYILGCVRGRRAGCFGLLWPGRYPLDHEELALWRKYWGTDSPGWLAYANWLDSHGGGEAAAAIRRAVGPERCHVYGRLTAA